MDGMEWTGQVKVSIQAEESGNVERRHDEDVRGVLYKT
jgi:hypothetical protein